MTSPRYLLFTRLLIRAFSDVIKPFIYFDLAALIANQKLKKALQRQRRLGLPSCLVDIKLTCTTGLVNFMQPGSWVIRAFSDVERPFLFSDRRLSQYTIGCTIGLQ